MLEDRLLERRAMTPKRAPGQDAMFGRYRLRGRLAAGGMAEVWAAQLLAPGGFVKPMVIKRVLPELAEQPSFLKMLMTEARVAARLSHANVCAVFELGEVAQEYYIAMEYLRGAPLSHVLKFGAVPPAVAVALVAQACDGLHYAHEQRDGQGALLGLVHRDVSPHNLFVTVDGVVKVLDFGIAKVDDGHSERTEEGKVKGKLTYMSPEQLAAEPLDRRTDVWALGVVLWELLTGKRLFGGGGPADTVDGIRNARVPRLGALGFGPEVARLDDVLAVALRVDRTARFTTAAELRRAMAEALSPTVMAGADELSHLVWERCGNEVRANDRRFEDEVDDFDTPPISPATALERLPLRAEHTEPSYTSAPVDTSPEIEVVRTPSAPAVAPAAPAVLPSTPPPVVAGFEEPHGRRWKLAAVIILLAGAAVIGALYAVRTQAQQPVIAAGPPPAATQPAPAPRPVVEPLVVDAPPAPEPPPPVAQIEPAQIEPAPPQPGPAKPPKPRPVDRPKPVGKGKLFLDAKPWATIYVDGRRLGVTPIVGEILSAGDHTIKAVAEDGRTKTMRVTVPANGDVRKKVTW